MRIRDTLGGYRCSSTRHRRQRQHKGIHDLVVVVVVVMVVVVMVMGMVIVMGIVIVVAIVGIPQGKFIDRPGVN